MTSGRFHNEEDATNSTTATSTKVTGTRASESCAENNFDESAEHLKKFVFTGASGVSNSTWTQSNNSNDSASNDLERLEIKIPELLQSGYSFYTWPSAPILAWFLWERRNAIAGKRILELGAGTALPGILSAKCGAQVTLSDNCILPKSLSHIRKCCLANDLVPGRDIQIIGLSWGLLLNSVFQLNALDLIIAADCFYDPVVFEDIIVTVAFLLERNPTAKFLFTYQERSADWSIEALLNKWKLHAVQINIDEVGKSSGEDLIQLMGGHTIHLIEITRN